MKYSCRIVCCLKKEKNERKKLRSDLFKIVLHIIVIHESTEVITVSRVVIIE